MPGTALRRLTPVLAVEAVEPSLEFWEQRVGFERTAVLPHGEGIGFALLTKDGIEVMLQSIASIRSDTFDATGDVHGRAATLFLEVADLDAVEQLLEGYPIAMPRRTTFYGMKELGVVEPGGHFIVFAQPV
jgi:uncharacterized glyoxalase superfamily protein PhnB